MVTELFDSVDMQDSVIGTTDKKQAHSTGLIHRVVAVYVFDKSSRLYVQHHKKANMFDHSVGGHVSQGESYDNAAVREALEELGLDAPLDFMATFYSDETYSGAPYRHFFALYTCNAPDDWNFEANEEVGAVEPMEISEVIQKMNSNPQAFTPGFLNSMEFYLNFINSDEKLDLAAILKNGY